MRQGCGDWLNVAVQAFNDSITTNEWAAVTNLPSRVGKGAKRRAHILSGDDTKWWARFALPTLHFTPNRHNRR